MSQLEDWCASMAKRWGLPMLDQPYLQGKRIGTKISFGNYIAPWIRLHTINDSSCLIHAVLLSLCSTYRKLSGPERAMMGEWYRYGIMASLPIFTEEEQLDIQAGRVLGDEIATKWLHYLGYNALFLIEYNVQGKYIGHIDLQKPFLQKPAVILYIKYGTNERYYEAVYPDMILHYEIAIELYEKEGGIDQAILRAKTPS